MNKLMKRLALPIIVVVMQQQRHAQLRAEAG